MSKIARDKYASHLAVRELLANTSKDTVANLLKSLVAIKKEVMILRQKPDLYSQSYLNKHSGLCLNIRNFKYGGPNNLDLFMNLYKLWPKYSGYCWLPIKESAGLNYNSCLDNFGLTKDTINSYTKARMELLNWCISMLDCYKGYAK